MPLPAREVLITYGSATLGGSSSSYYLDAPLRFNMSADRAVVEADVIVIGTSESDFRTQCTNLETYFKTPRQKLVVKFGTAVHETFDSTDGINTGFNQVPSISKVGDEIDTGRSRRYRIAVATDLPADLYVNSAGASTNARRNTTINLYTTDSGRRRCTITGSYTASGTSGLGAREQYNAQITTYITTITSSFGGTWETLFDPQVATDDMNKVCNFAVVLEELIFNQSQGTLDDPALRRQRMTITRAIDTSGDSLVFGIKPQKIQRVMFDYSVSVDKSVTQDLKSVWSGTIKPYLASLAASISDGSVFIESEVPTFDFVENRIAARISFATMPGSLLSARITTDESENTGITLVPVWDIDRLKKYSFSGPATITRTVTIFTTEVGLPGSKSIVGPGGAFDSVIGGNSPPAGNNASADIVSIAGADQTAGLAVAGGVPEAKDSPEGGALKRIFLGATHSSSPRRIGPIDGAVIDVVDRVVVARYEYFVDAAGDKQATSL